MEILKKLFSSGSSTGPEIVQQAGGVTLSNRNGHINIKGKVKFVRVNGEIVYDHRKRDC